ncbi:Rod shape-determining protein MreD [Candidatus Providencia siddallii]|uniref:Rod shape-determining protein MreD n=1 Tax=Candidatus Providencia siddallii TaxID=1715285 RepID=A0A0M6W871_9GAMM|nr:Rod shape-determining protein MreD [Candidatus Providencia siddallii]
MKECYSNNRGIIYLSFFIALILQVMPWPEKFDFYKPAWLFLILLYWIIHTPYLVKIWSSFITGIIIDSIDGSIFGVHALSFTIICYLASYNDQSLYNTSLFQQILFVVMFTFIKDLIVFVVEFLSSQALFYPQIFWNSIINGILWPLLFLFFRKIRRNVI